MEYTGAVGVIVMEQLVTVNDQVPDDHTFSRTGLRDFVSNHEERLERVEEYQNLTEHALHNLQIVD